MPDRSSPYLAAAVLAGAAAPLGAADLPEGVVLDLRYRYAHIEQDGYARSADANTLRFTLGYLWTSAAHWSAYAEGTRVSGVFGDSYNSGANGRTDLPAEGDPPSSEISSAWIAWRSDAAEARAGRQYVNLDNQRFFTSGLWRQNPQSFDALDASWRFGAGTTTLRYIHVDQANRSVGRSYPDPMQREWSLDGNLFHLDQELPLGRLAAYDYLVDNETQARYSWRTAGLRWTGEQRVAGSRLVWTAEFARQDGWRSNPQRYDVGYRLLEVGYGEPMLALRLGDERLGADGRNAFSSPYGSNRGFNGWTSQFRTVPAAGLDDRFVTLSGTLAERLSWGVTAHDFYAERAYRRYGSELDAMLKYALLPGLEVEADYADYRRDTFAASQRALWLAIEYRHGQPGGL